MKVIILGSGGREHALAWKISKSTILEKLWIAPGNAGTASVGENVNLKINDFKQIKTFVLENDIDIVLVGPEDPLVNGIHDYFSASPELKNVTVIGPKKAGAQLEGSKDFAKSFMKKYNIPTAAYQTFDKTRIEEGKAFLAKLKSPYVLKADGLAGGKGVLIIDDLKQAQDDFEKMLTGKQFGAASKKVVIEEFLDGIELSVFIITDGKSYKVLPAAKDYKRIGEGDTGLNTGGMGAVSPVPFAKKDFLDKVEDRIIKPTIRGLQDEGIDYQGFLFIGLMNVRNEPYVIEYNVRMGDPETEVVIPRLRSDLLDLFEGIVTGTLSERDIEIDMRAATTVVMVADGYPGAYNKGMEITGLDEVEDSVVFHSGTTEKKGKILSDGGRILAVTSFGKTIEKALQKSYDSIEKIHYSKKYFRGDIGQDLIKKPQNT